MQNTHLVRTLRTTRVSRYAAAATLLVMPLGLVNAATAQTPAGGTPTAGTTVAQNAPLSLRQKWTAGQQLDYDANLNGTVSMQASPNIPSMFAGIPLDIDVHMEAASTLDTLAVNEQGTGTVAVRLNRLQLKGESFGQKADYSVRDGRATLTMNGQRMGPVSDASAFTNPTTALQISSQARLTGIVPVPGVEDNPAAPNRRMPFDPSAITNSVFWRVIPTLWPEQAVKVGETWTADVVFPKEAIQNANAANQDLNLGKVALTLRGAEAVAGRQTWRIAVDGGFEVNAAQAELMQSKRAAATVQPAQNTPNRTPRIEQKLVRAGVKMKGDIWFDAALGQVARVELQLETQAASRDVLPPGFKGKRMAKQNPNDPDSWVDFTGTLQMQLKNVSTKAAAP